MAFFEELGKKLSDAGQGVAQQTKNLTEIARLNSAISDKEKKVSQLYSALGQAYYQQHSNDPSAEERQKIDEINALLAEVAKCREDINLIKGIVKCSNCGADVPVNASFCNACGTKVTKPQEAEPVAESNDACPNCGAAVGKDNLFCIHCGTKLKA